MNTHYDVAIAGAGPAGGAVAQSLVQAGCSVVLLERSHFDRPRIGETLAPAVQPLLLELGVWQVAEVGTRRALWHVAVVCAPDDERGWLVLAKVSLIARKPG